MSLNAIAAVQFRLQGGWRGTGITAGICLAVLGGILALNLVSAAGGGIPVSGVVRDWPQGLLMLQLLFLLIVAPLRVASAIRVDVASRMIESHRLMPLSPFSAVAGYVLGGPWAAAVLAGSAFAFGTACCLIGGQDPFAWLLANGVLAGVSLCLCAITAYLSLASRLGILLLVIMFLVSLVAHGGSAEVLPGLGLMTTPLVGRASVLMLRSSQFVGTAWAFGLAALLAVAALCFRAAMRLYRTPGCVGLSPRLGLLLLLVWLAASLLGIAWPETVGAYGGYRGTGVSTELVGSVVAALVVAALPIAAAAREWARYQQAGGSRDGARRPVSPVWVAAAAAALIAVFPVLAAGAVNARSDDLPVTPAHSTQAVLLTAAVVLATLLALAFLFQRVYLRWAKAWPAALGWIGLAWTVPLMADAVTASLTARDGFGPVGTISPIGALSVLWTRSDTSPVIGIALQFALPAVLGLALWAALAKGRRTQAQSEIAGLY